MSGITDDPVGLGLAKESNVTIFLEAENAAMQGGKLDGTYVSQAITGFSGIGYVTGFDTNFNFAQVMAQVAKETTADLTIRIHAEDDFHADVLVGKRV